MKFKNNENGYALLLVMMLVLLFTTLGMGLLAMNINASKQFNIKEEQVQARHFAEMGVLHYKAKVKPIVELINLNKVKKLSCDDFPEIINEFSSENKEIYEVKIDPNKCDDSGKGKVELFIVSIGKAEDRNNNVEKIIEAEIIVINNADDNEGGSTAISGGIPKKPSYPEGMTTVTNLDSINGTAVRVNNGTSNNQSFESDAFIEVSGNLDNIPRKSIWTFNNHLLIDGDLKLSTSGANSPIVVVNKDLYIKGDLYLPNHDEVRPNGNITVNGDVELGNHAAFNIKGNALFEGTKFIMKPNTLVNINKNAYFRNRIAPGDGKGEICVKGQAYLFDSINGYWKLYEDLDRETYKHFNTNCFGQWEGEQEVTIIDWEMQPNIDAIYK